ncbi:tigger transposable element-derived protein 6-like [Diorhabda sublineata]|uniref:tigger transposable element-derived protein 6-like n=1 Tax=Diorhabda sublineata TaxID=1163346 RepID=UPI0024E09523|nr:tigger transposable element-derived protein 6-like [Diorhabda sublineata]
MRTTAADFIVTGPMLEGKAKEIAARLNNTKFQAILCGEAAGIDLEEASDWKKKIPGLLKDYHPKDSFNVDETALIYWQSLRKFYVKKNDSCKGSKLSKERLSDLFCCSSTGEKLKPLVIGNSKKTKDI